MKIYVNEKLQNALDAGLAHIHSDSPSLHELISTLQKIEDENPSRNLKVGINTFDSELWISDSAEDDEAEYFVPLLEWN
jgi:hypothetical protein